MKLLSYLFDGHDHLSLLADERIYEMENLHPDIPNTMGMFLQYWDDAFPMAFGGGLMVKEGRISADKGTDPGLTDIIAPVPFPASFRSATGITGTTPQYSFGNHHSILGGGTIHCLPGLLGQISFEPQIALVIAKHGRNISAASADDYIAGLMIMNKFRSEANEHFATATGPWLVTVDELTDFEVPAKEGHTGKAWDLHLHVRVNDEKIAALTTANLEWTFAELIEKVAHGIDLYPGDIIGCGPLGNVGYLLNEGDTIEVEVKGLGLLRNTIAAEEEIS